MKTFEAIIPIYYLPYLINNDDTNLEDTEMVEIDAWYRKQCNYFECAHIHCTMPEWERPYFSHSNDINHLGCDVFDCVFFYTLNP